MNQTRVAQSHAIAADLLAEFERECVSTRRFLERLPNDRLTWRPHAKSMSAGQLGHHIAETPGLALRFSLPDRGTPPDFTTRKASATVGEMLAVFDAGVACVRETLPTVSDERMRAQFVIDLPGGTAMEMPRGRFLRDIMLNHWYHHRGQLGVYLRLLGLSVPSSYGPSGDESGPG